MDILVVSYGGVGTTDFIRKLNQNGIRTNDIDDRDGLKHISDPAMCNPKPKRAIYMFDCPILANKSHFRRNWFWDQVRKTSNGINKVSKEYTWSEFLRDNKDWCMMEQHWDNWNTADFPVLFLKLSDAYKHNDVISKFLGFETTIEFFIKKNRNCKIMPGDRLSVYDSLVSKQNLVNGFKILNQ